jgi:hypothetical protein
MMMQDDARKQYGISVRVVGWRAISRPLVRVVVDDQSVGILKDKQPQTFPVTPGRHTVKARRDFFRSQVLEFDLSARHHFVDFECGFQAVQPWLLSLPGKAVTIAAAIPCVLAVTALKLPYWSWYVPLGFALVAVAIDLWYCYIPAGAHLYIRQVTQTSQRP